MKAVPYILGISQDVVKEMVGSSYTPACCVSKLRSCLEAGKKLLRVWLQYVYGVIEMLLYPSFRVGFKPSFLTLGRANTFVLHLLNRKILLVLLWSSNGDSEMARNRFEEGSKWCATGNVCGMANGTIFLGLRTYVHGWMNLFKLRKFF